VYGSAAAPSAYENGANDPGSHERSVLHGKIDRVVALFPEFLACQQADVWREPPVANRFVLKIAGARRSARLTTMNTEYVSQPWAMTIPDAGRYAKERDLDHISIRRDERSERSRLHVRAATVW